ncbi:MAG: LysR substrate-binding domain-containing protein, partial [Deferrisomatales bacterium]
SDRIELYAGASFAVAAPLRLGDLAGVSLVHREGGSGTRKAVETQLRRAGVDPEDLEVVAEFGSTAAVKEAVKAGIGAAFLSSAAVSCEVAGGLVRRVAVDGMEAVERRFYAVWDPQRVLPPAAAAFLALLLEEVRGG